MWSKGSNSVVYGLNEITFVTSGADVGEFEKEQERQKGNYLKLRESIPNSKVGKYGLAMPFGMITFNGREMELYVGDKDTLTLAEYDMYGRVVTKFNKEVYNRLTEEELGLLRELMQDYLVDEYLEELVEDLGKLRYESDIGLIKDLLNIVNKWYSLDGIKGEILIEPYGWEFDFGLKHPVVIHTGEYGYHQKGIDRTFFAHLLKEDTLYRKVNKFLSVMGDFNYWLNPLDVTYTTNRTYRSGSGEGKGIVVTLKDLRIQEYQKYIENQMYLVKSEDDRVLWYNITFSNNTRSAYIDLKFRRNIPELRFTIRDHDKTYEEEIPVIRINTLQPQNIVERVLNLIEETHILNKK